MRRTLPDLAVLPQLVNGFLRVRWCQVVVEEPLRTHESLKVVRWWRCIRRHLPCNQLGQVAKYRVANRAIRLTRGSELGGGEEPSAPLGTPTKNTLSELRHTVVGGVKESEVRRTRAPRSLPQYPA